NLTGERVNIFRSLDNGASFSAPLNGTPGFVAAVDFADKPWIAVDNNPGPGYGNVYLAWVDLTSPTGPRGKGMFFTRSTDDGLTWGPSGGVLIAPPTPSGNEAEQGAYVTVGPDHAVYVFYWGFGPSGEFIAMRKSMDQGQTFSNPVVVDNLKTNGTLGDLGLKDSQNRKFRSNAFPQAAVNPVTGDIYVTFNDDGKGSDRADVYFTESTDGGNTWSSPLR